jgi:ribose 5-phosphate isomerase A
MSGFREMPNLELEKAVAARRAVLEIRDGMLVGLGTGSTASHAIRQIGLRVKDEGLKITATATSKASEVLAASLNIPLVPLEQVSQVDLAIDGADEVDGKLRAIKGGGGALLREKIVATLAVREIIVVDSSKAVEVLGRFKLPVEVLPFAAAFAERALGDLGVPVALRRTPDGQSFLTDQGNRIYDIAFDQITEPEELARRLESLPGVVEHGLFLSQIDMVVIANGDKVKVIGRTKY